MTQKRPLVSHFSAASSGGVAPSPANAPVRYGKEASRVTSPNAPCEIATPGNRGSRGRRPARCRRTCAGSVGATRAPAQRSGRARIIGREHRRLHLSSRQAHPQYLGQVMWRVRSGQLKRDQENTSRSRLRRQSNRCGCTSQFYRCGSANPVQFGSGFGS